MENRFSATKIRIKLIKSSVCLLRRKWIALDVICFYTHANGLEMSTVWSVWQLTTNNVILSRSTNFTWNRAVNINTIKGRNTSMRKCAKRRNRYGNGTKKSSVRILQSHPPKKKIGLIYITYSVVQSQFSKTMTGTWKKIWQLSRDSPLCTV